VLPGKQMSIDSDLNAGLIDEGEARERRKKLAAEAEFYGAWTGPADSPSATRWRAS